MKTTVRILLAALVAALSGTQAMAQQPQALLTLEGKTARNQPFKAEVAKGFAFENAKKNDTSAVRIRLAWNVTNPVEDIKLRKFYILEGDKSLGEVVTVRFRHLTQGSFRPFVVRTGSQSTFKAVMVYSDADDNPFIVEKTFTINWKRMDISEYVPSAVVPGASVASTR